MTQTEHTIEHFGAFLRATMEDEAHHLTDVMSRINPMYAEVNRENDLRQPVLRTLGMLADAIEYDKLNELSAYSYEVGAYRARNGFRVQDMVIGARQVREFVWNQLECYQTEQGFVFQPAQLRHVETVLHTFLAGYVASVGEVLIEARADIEMQRTQLAAQQAIIRELGVPIIPVHAGVLVLPLVGALDGTRATQVIESLLEAVAHHQAMIVIIDLTGVPLVDTNVANHLLQATRATNLIGAQVVLVGISAEIAQTMVHIGIDMGRVTTLANLQAGLAYAYAHLGYRLVR